ncbi:aspartic peptidase domain-containing protein [Epithele typhae]|uniref:aspartic peptidase domain-containing protein n=1 Tax=Epithele typhae TaxID=378194 RepID=UPI002008BBDC|nr:aspartic peptidase domain-containing protein [Epithele typhae]KAH9946219.1 aspartic peptidase domain-containing protein [Epithele typhae]
MSQRGGFAHWLVALSCLLAAVRMLGRGAKYLSNWCRRARTLNLESRRRIGGQAFSLLLDTGSSDLWVVSSDCISEECAGVRKYNRTSSLTLTDQPFHLDYLAGNVTGLVGADTARLGDFEVSEQTFAMANSTNGLGLSDTGNSGILGLAFPAEASIPDTIGRTIADNLFSGLNDDSQVARQGRPSPIAVLDTGTTLILGPTADVARFWASVGGARQSERGWEIPCTRGVSVSFALGEGDQQTAYAVDPADMSWAAEGSVDLGDWCLGGVQANDGVNFAADWLLGDTFLRNVYATHHVATGSRPPAIGLRGLTDPPAAQAAFVARRGADPLPPSRVVLPPPADRALTGGDICGIATACGVVAGAVIVVLFMARKGRRRSGD